MSLNRLHPPRNGVDTKREGIPLPYKVWRGRTQLPGIQDSLDEARGLVESDIIAHPEAVAALWGVFPGVRWSWDAGTLLARSNDNDAVAYSICPVIGP